jgi:hypothetical protein
MGQTLNWDERTHYRDRLRAARYAALADAEAFSEICFVIEALGTHLTREEGAMARYRGSVEQLACDSVVLSDMPATYPHLFMRFGALYKMVQNARNDAMHSGVYARHVTVAAIELCIGLEEALMTQQQIDRTKVKDFMVRGAVTVEPWHPVAYARQLMLMHSFTFLPVRIGEQWHLIPEVAMAKFLRAAQNRNAALGMPIENAAKLMEGAFELIEAQIVSADDEVADLLATCDVAHPQLWVVTDGHGGIAGVLSPFELM